MMGVMGKRITSFLMACLMVLSLLPAAALADDPGYSLEGETLTITGEEIDNATLATATFRDSVKRIRIGENALTKEIMTVEGYKLFSYFQSLEYIEVDPANTVFKDIDGVLFSADGVILYAYPPKRPGGSYVLPAGVAKLAAEAFCGEAPTDIYARESTEKAIYGNWNSYKSCHQLSDFDSSAEPKHEMHGSYHKIHSNYIDVTGVVLKDAGGVVRTDNEITVYKNGSIDLEAVVDFASEEGDTIGGVTWESDDPNVATVEQDGTVTGVSVGTTTITATSKGVGADDQPRSASCTVTVPAISVKLDKSTLALTISDHEEAGTGKLKATLTPDGANTENVEWNWVSSNANVATVAQDGTVTAVGHGTATVTVTATSNGESYTATCEVTVTVATVGLEIREKNDGDDDNDGEDEEDNEEEDDSENESGGKVIELVYGSTTGSGQKTVTVKRKAKKGYEPTDEPELVWSTGDQDIVAVAKDGDYNAILTPKKAGHTKLTVMVKDKPEVYATCDVHVFTPANGVTLDQPSMELRLENGSATGKLTATIIDAGSSSDSTAKQEVEWQIINPSDSIVIDPAYVIDKTAPTPTITITAKHPGTATIRATAKGTTYYADCIVTVLQPTMGITLTPNNPLSLDINGIKTDTLTAKITPFDSTDPVTWSIDTAGKGVVELGEATTNKGTEAITVTIPVTAIGAGTATVTVTSGEHSKDCTIKVPVPVTGVKLDKEALTLKIGGNETLTVTVLPNNAENKDVTWKSDNEGIATVANGVVTAVAPGTATITVTTVDGGFTASCVVTVLASTAGITIIDEEAKDEQAGQSGELKANDVIELTYSTVGSGQKALTVMLASNSGNLAPTDDPELVFKTEPENIVSAAIDGKITNGKAKMVLTALQASVKEVTVTVSVKDKNEILPAKFKARVYSPAAGLELSKTEMTFDFSDKDENHLSKELTATVLDANNRDPSTAKQEIKWEVIDDKDGKVIELAHKYDEAAPVYNITTNTVTAKGPGTATIRATVVGTGYTETCVVTVLQPTAKIELKSYDSNKKGTGTVADPRILILNEDDKKEATLIAEITPADTTDDVTWSVSKAGVVNLGTAKVLDPDDPDGDQPPRAVKMQMPITAVGDGTVTITARSGDKEATYTVTVKTAVTGVSLDRTTLTLKEGDKATLTATVAPANATNQTVTWGSSKEDVATVDNGVVTAVGGGTTTITVTTDEKDKDDKPFTATCDVTVIPHTTKVTLNAANAGNLTGGKLVLYCNGNGSTFLTAADLTARIEPAESKDEVTWSVSPGGIVSLGDVKSDAVIDNSGSNNPSTRDVTIPITAVAPGLAVVTATSNSHSASYTVTVKRLAESVSLDTNELTITEKGEATITAAVLPSDASDKAVKWSVNDDKIARIIRKTDNSVTIWGVSAGTCTVTATATDGSGKTAECTVTVKAIPVSSVSFVGGNSYTLRVGDTINITAAAYPEDAGERDIKFELEDNLNADGKSILSEGTVVKNTADALVLPVTALAVGTATITATSVENAKLFAICTVTVEPVPVQSITISGSTAFDLHGTKEQTFTATIDPAKAADYYDTVTWTSSDESVAKVGDGSSCTTTIDSYGKFTAMVTAEGAGTATITATVDGTSIKDSIPVTVPVAVDSIGLDKNELNLVVGETATLTPKITPANAVNQNVEWESSNTDVVTVSRNGVVTAVSAGTAQITATTDGGEVATCTVNVAQETITIQSGDGEPAVATDTVTLGPKGTAQLKAVVTPGYVDKTVKWTIRDNSVAELSDNGDGTATVTARSNGITTVTATTVDGRATDSCTVKVETPAEGVFIRDLALGAVVSGPKVLYTDDKDPLRLSAYVLPEGSTYKSVTWSGYSESVVKFTNKDSYVEFSPLSPGDTKITVTVTTDNNTFSSTIPVEVRKRAESLTMKEALVLEIGGSDTLTVSAGPDGANLPKLSWSSLDPSVAAVSSTGQTAGTAQVTGKAAGKATITATSVEDGSIQAQCVVRVYKPVNELTIRNRADGNILVNGDTLKLSILDKNGPATELKPVLDPADATVDGYEWKSSKDGVVDVTPDGEVYVRNVGDTHITLTAKMPDGKTKTATFTVIVEKAELDIEPSTQQLYTPDMGAVTFTVSPIDDETQKLLKWEYTYKGTDETSAQAATVAKTYNKTTQTYTYSITPLRNGEYTVDVSLTGVSSTYDLPGTTSYSFEALGNPITGAEMKNLDPGEDLYVSVNNTNHIITVAGFADAPKEELANYDLSNKLDLKLYDGGKIDGSGARVNANGLDTYFTDGGRGNTITVRQYTKDICVYTLERRIVSLPENISFNNSSIVLVGGNNDEVSLDDEQMEKRAEELNAAVAEKILSDHNFEASEKYTVEVKLNITDTTGKSSNGVESVSLDIEPTYTITKEDGETVSDTIRDLSLEIEISVIVHFEPKAIVHKTHDGTYELLAFHVTDNQNGTWTVTWSQQTFSEVRLLAASEARSGSIRFEFDDGSYAQLPYGEADVGKAFAADNSREGFTGWSVAGMTGVNTLTDALLTAINGKTATATPEFTPSGDGDSKDKTDTPGGGSAPGTPSKPGSGTGTGNNTPPVDGPTTETIENADGSTATTVILPDGSRGVTVTNADGTTRSASAAITAEAVRAARQSGKPVTVPVRVAVAPNPETAAVVTVELPKTDTPLRLAIPADGAGLATVAVLVHDDGTEEIIRNSIVVDGAVVFYADSGVKVKIVDNIKDFDDVDESFWGSEAVRFVAARGIFNGEGGRIFSPDEATTRGMLSQVLYNFDGSAVEVTPRSAFGDVTEDDWFFEAVSWCTTAGIVNGYPDGTFGGIRDISRQELVVCLYRYAQGAGLLTDVAADLGRFPDAGSVQSYAWDAMSWAVGNGLIVGTDNGVLDPDGPATRAQAATIMMRFCYLIPASN